MNEVKKDGGNIAIFGKDNLEHEKVVKDSIGIVFDECHFPDLFNAIELGKSLRWVYSEWNSKTYIEYLTRFELPKDKPINTYSKGMKIKLAFAVALSHNPQFLILDEATSGLDPVMRDEVLDILLEFVQDETHSVLFSSHITSDLEKIADYITFLHKGKLIFNKTKDELIYKYGIIKCGSAQFDSLVKRITSGKSLYLT